MMANILYIYTYTHIYRERERGLLRGHIGLHGVSGCQGVSQ